MGSTGRSIRVLQPVRTVDGTKLRGSLRSLNGGELGISRDSGVFGREFEFPQVASSVQKHCIYRRLVKIIAKVPLTEGMILIYN
jgi:hypothetical protein